MSNASFNLAIAVVLTLIGLQVNFSDIGMDREGLRMTAAVLTIEPGESREADDQSLFV